MNRLRTMFARTEGTIVSEAVCLLALAVVVYVGLAMPAAL